MSQADKENLGSVFLLEISLGSERASWISARYFKQGTGTVTLAWKDAHQASFVTDTAGWGRGQGGKQCYSKLSKFP